MMPFKTTVTKLKTINRSWHLVDLKDQILGRAAVNIATLLQGKNKPYFTPHLDCGDYVVAINAQDIKLTGNKALKKEYFSHSGYPKGAKVVPFRKRLEKNPQKIIATAVSGMLPKNKLRSP
ncbi:MAG: 50S ribosomal protein L13, partial [Candidatus Chisholmbacteria bacterium]|nr:50S ribosomal protein L13 [Candidatus Chisholmbacteria bacterium]